MIFLGEQIALSSGKLVSIIYLEYACCSHVFVFDIGFSFQASLGHTAWGLALAWITLACCTGYGGPINTVLSFRGFLPLSRLTYCAYLVHPMLQCIISFQMDGPLHLHNAMVVGCQVYTRLI